MNGVYNLGEYERAINLLEQALAISREIGNLSGEAIALHNIGLSYGRLGQHELAIDFYEQVLEIAGRLGDPALAGTALGNQGSV